MSNEAHDLWEDDFVDSNYSVKDSEAWRLGVAESKGIMHSMGPYPKESRMRREQKQRGRHRQRPKSGSDEEPRKPNVPRRLHWHVSYGKGKGGSPK